MFDLVAQYYWILALPFPIWFAVDCERRAYGLAGAGRLSAAEAGRLTRFVWLGALAVIAAVLIIQFSYTGRRGHCAWFDDPLRPGALLTWLLIGGVVIRIASLAVSPGGSEFLTRVWPAAMISKPLSQVWERREVVRSTLLNIALFVLLFGGLVGLAIVRPGSVARC